MAHRSSLQIGGVAQLYAVRNPLLSARFSDQS
jgi:hypothetical protein